MINDFIEFPIGLKNPINNNIPQCTKIELENLISPELEITSCRIIFQDIHTIPYIKDDMNAGRIILSIDGINGNTRSYKVSSDKLINIRIEFSESDSIKYPDCIFYLKLRFL